MGKNVIRRLKLELEAGKANPAKVGKDLAPTGINLLAFCQKYNELTAGQQGMIIPAEVTVFEDRSFVLRTKTPPTAFLLKRSAGIEKGAARPGHETVATLSRKDLEKIAEIRSEEHTSELQSREKLVCRLL